MQIVLLKPCADKQHKCEILLIQGVTIIVTICYYQLHETFFSGVTICKHDLFDTNFLFLAIVSISQPFSISGSMYKHVYEVNQTHRRVKFSFKFGTLATVCRKMRKCPPNS